MTQNPGPRLCPRCERSTLAGADDGPSRIPTVLDPTPLDRRAEARALLTGRATYALVESQWQGWVVHWRDHWHIAAHPAGTVTVLPDHRCGQPLARAVLLRSRRREELPADGPAPF